MALAPRPAGRRRHTLVAARPATSPAGAARATFGRAPHAESAAATVTPTTKSIARPSHGTRSAPANRTRPSSVLAIGESRPARAR